MKGLILFVFAVVLGLFAVQPAEAVLFPRLAIRREPVIVQRQAILAPQAVVVRQRFVAPLVQRVVVPQAIVVPHVQQFVVPGVQSFRVQSFSSGGGCGALLIR